MPTNKHAAMQDWLAECPLLDEELLFDFLNERNGSASISPVSGEAWVKRYVRNSGVKRYQFAVQVMLAASDSTDSTNTDNMYLLDMWREWIEDQENAGNYPDFGERCSSYELSNLSNMPQLAQRYESGFAKYTFYAQIQYYDKGD